MKQLRQIIMGCYLDRDKWPTTGNKDFSGTRESLQSTCQYTLNGETVEVQTYYFPLYSIYVANGWKLEPGLEIGNPNNLLEPDPAVLQQLRLQLTAFGNCYDIILWPHALLCYPYVGDLIRKFKLSIMTFGDDCPGSSEQKSFPVCRFFDAIVHRMLIWDYASGVRSETKYKEHGAKRCYHDLGGPDPSLHSWIGEGNLDLPMKLRRMSHFQLPIDLIWIGCIGWMNPERSAFLTELNRRAAEWQGAGKTVLYGKDMRDGIVGSQGRGTDGIWTGPLYRDSLFGLNYPASSIFNGRFFDLPLTGTIQVLHDRNDELKTVGMLPEEHYLSFDGTVDNLFSVMARAKARSDLAGLGLRAHEKALELLEQNSLLTQRILADHAEQLLA